jgi:hypothetical protein
LRTAIAGVALVLAACAREREALKRPVQEACPLPPAQPAKETCGKQSCESGLVLALQPKAPWRAGTYRFRFEVDERVVACTGSLPLKPCAQRSAVCDYADVTLSESGCDLPPAQQAFGSVSFQGFPRKVTARAFRDGEPIGSVELEPHYARSQPNGEGCDPMCCAASAALQLSLR